MRNPGISGVLPKRTMMERHEPIVPWIHLVRFPKMPAPRMSLRELFPALLQAGLLVWRGDRDDRIAPK